MENILFSIGDYSSDGHSFCADIIVESNKTVKELRNIHLKENDFIGNICSEYEDTNLSIAYLYEFLERYNGQEKAIKTIQAFIEENELIMSNIFNDEELTEKSFIDLSFEDFEIVFEDKPKELLSLWLLLLKTIDNSFSYTILSEPISKYYVKYKGYPYEVSDEFIYSKKEERNFNLKIPGYGVWSGNSDEEFYLG